jgi:hypothetical protein
MAINIHIQWNHIWLNWPSLASRHLPVGIERQLKGATRFAQDGQEEVRGVVVAGVVGRSFQWIAAVQVSGRPYNRGIP